MRTGAGLVTCCQTDSAVAPRASVRLVSAHWTIAGAAAAAAAAATATATEAANTLLLICNMRLCAAGLAAGGLLPADPVVALVLLLQGAMPTAQNLVVLLNLDEKVCVQAGRAVLQLVTGSLASCLTSFHAPACMLYVSGCRGHMVQQACFWWSCTCVDTPLSFWAASNWQRSRMCVQTQAGAARLAELLLRLYALAIVPLTLWVTAFVLQLPVPLEAL